MQKILSAVIAIFAILNGRAGANAQDTTAEYAVQVSAAVQTAPPRITLSWPQDTRAVPNSYTVFRKAGGASAWGTGTALPGTTTSYADSNVAEGAAYEYQIVKQSPLGYSGYGYIHAGLQSPLVENRGKVILVVDNTHAASLAMELQRLEQDLIGDGWSVARLDVARTASPATVKGLIKSQYTADPQNTKAVFLFGRIPVLRSGNLNVDGHQARALPADAFYGDMDGAWTDANSDGIYDQNRIPSDIELQVGRVDFANMPGKKAWNDPGSFPSELELLRQYLNKNHRFRHKLMTAPARGLLGNRFGDFGGEAFAASGYRNFSTFFGAGQTAIANVIDTAPVAEKWISLLGASRYLWSYGCGGGSATSISGLGTNGLYSDVWSVDIVSADAKAVFNLYFGSWLVDWDTPDNIMRSALATPTMGLTCSWSGRPHHYYHHMAQGETAGYGIRLSQNNNGLYKNQHNSEQRGIHIALMGDPTLRMHPVAPPSALSGSISALGAQLSWTAAPEAVLGYHIYRAASASGPFTRVTSALAAGTSFTDASVTSGTQTYMARAVKLESTPSGTYFNASQGAFATINNSNPNPTPERPVITVQATDPNAAEAGLDPGVLTLTRTGSTASALTVNLTLSGAAQNGIDYTALSAFVTIPAGLASAAVIVTPIDDSAVEGSETVTLDIASNASYDLGPSHSATVTIADNDSAPAPAPVLPVVTVTAADATATEGNSDPGVFTFTRTGDTAGVLHVNYAFSGTAIKWTDYRRLEGDMPVSITIPAGAASAALTIYAADDSDVEGSESVMLIIASDSAYTAGSPGSAMVTIVDNDSAPAPAPTFPVVTVTATDATASEGNVDPAAFTFTRTGGTDGALTVNYALSGTAIKWTDYRRLEGDMPVAFTIPAGSSSAALAIFAYDDAEVEGSETVVLNLLADAAYELGTPGSATVVIADNDGVTTPPPAPPPGGTYAPPPVSLVDYTNLELPKPGQHTLHILSPTVLELVLINTKQPDPARVESWDFVDASLQFRSPSLQEFSVTVDGQPVAVQAAGFKRRPLFAPLGQRDLRIQNSLCLRLASALAGGQLVEVTNPSGTLWSADKQFTATAHPHRYSPAIHVNQEGYLPSLPKKATAGYYLGSLGELELAAPLDFTLIDVNTGAEVFRGALQARLDQGYHYAPAPYQKVLEADFSSYTVPGEYRLAVPGLGASLPFVIDDGVAMSFARTYALGLYHQRCGTNCAMPYTRHTHGPCHLAQAEVPVPQASYAFTWSKIAQYNANYASNPRHTAPQLNDEASMLYPFVKTGKVDVSGGHHDAGDYSKYTINVAGLIHYLIFAVDAFPGVAALDNLGLPESGDGISDLLQEAKWEADFLAKMQDSDGGFYFLVYPRDRAYENNVLPDQGDPQIVWPKNTSATAAAVAALAQTAASPEFKRRYPSEAAAYLQKAKLGWQFLLNAIARHGKDGSYQMVNHYGNEFLHDDELAWAACELFLATGDPTCQQKLFEWYPNPNDASTYRWTWWRLWEAYGRAARSYAFAARTGRLASNQLNGAYLAKCEAELLAGAQDHCARADANAYGTSFPLESKRVQSAGWYFSSERAFDITAAYQIEARPEFMDAILSNLNYEGGVNPVNVTFVTGLGWKRQREIVHQYAQNDRRVLPPAGIPLGNIQTGFAWLTPYQGELAALNFPQDGAASAPYPFYDRWGDSFNVTTEFVNVDQARSVASLAFLATLTPAKLQSWKPVAGQILGLKEIGINEPVTLSFQAGSLDLGGARILWEARDQEPAYGTSVSFVPSSFGEYWVEAEAQWPDGRRVVAMTSVFATNGLPTVTVTATDAGAIEATQDPASFTFTRSGSLDSALTVHYSFSGTATKWTDYRRLEGDMPVSIVIPSGSAAATLVLYPVVDSITEGTETAILTVSPGAAYNVGSPASGTASIADTAATAPPPPPTVSVTATDAAASEAGQDPGVFTFTRAGDTSAALTVRYVLSGTAIKWTDYRRWEGDMPVTITIPAGASTAALTIYPFDDAELEGSETVILTLIEDSSYLVGSPAAATVHIADNDGVATTVTVMATDANASRVGPDPGAFTITRTGSTANPLIVNYALGGTAVRWTDYRTLNGDMPVAVTIPAGSTSATITIVPQPSSTLVDTQTVVLTLTAGTNYTAGPPGSATITMAGNSVAITSIKAAKSTVTLTWNSQVGKRYRVASKNDLTEPQWTDLSGAITATGAVTSWTDRSSNKLKERHYTVYVID